MTINEIATRTGSTYDAIRMALDRHGDQHAAHLLSVQSLEPKFAWLFPNEYRDALEKLYAERPDDEREWSRIWFFINLTYKEAKEIERQLSYVSDEDKRRELEKEFDLMRDMNHQAIYTYIDFLADAKVRKVAPCLHLHVRQMSEEEAEYYSGYRPERDGTFDFVWVP